MEDQSTKEQILARYTARTPGSRTLDLQAKKSLPGGHLMLPAHKAPLLDYYVHGVGHLLERTRSH